MGAGVWARRGCRYPARVLSKGFLRIPRPPPPLPTGPCGTWKKALLAADLAASLGRLVDNLAEEFEERTQKTVAVLNTLHPLQTAQLLLAPGGATLVNTDSLLASLDACFGLGPGRGGMPYPRPGPAP